MLLYCYCSFMLQDVLIPLLLPITDYRYNYLPRYCLVVRIVVCVCLTYLILFWGFASLIYLLSFHFHSWELYRLFMQHAVNVIVPVQLPWSFYICIAPTSKVGIKAVLYRGVSGPGIDPIWQMDLIENCTTLLPMMLAWLLKVRNIKSGINCDKMRR